MQRQKLDLEKLSVCHILIIWAFNAWRPFYWMLSAANQQMIKGKFHGRDWMKICTRRLQCVLKCWGGAGNYNVLWFRMIPLIWTVDDRWGRTEAPHELKNVTWRKQRKLLCFVCDVLLGLYFISAAFHLKKNEKMKNSLSSLRRRNTVDCVFQSYLRMFQQCSVWESVYWRVLVWKESGSIGNTSFNM